MARPVMKIVITGATGNVGTSVLEALADEPRIEEIVGLARRIPERQFPRTRFVAADVADAGLAGILHGADAVVHLAWLIQPGRDEAVTSRVNVIGRQPTRRSDRPSWRRCSERSG